MLIDEFKMNDPQIQTLQKTLTAMTINEVLALALSLGPAKFVVGPLAIVWAK